jgi:Cu-processing system permease protein
MYYYNSRDFSELLLAQPVKRSNIFLGQYFGVAISLSLSLVVGLLIPFSIFGLFRSEAIIYFVNLLLIGTSLTFIFVAFAYNIALTFEDKIKGFGVAILTWLFFAIIYDGLFLVSLLIFDEYPIDKFALIASILNPIDLSRILILLKLDISALLGYTGAVFQRFFGTNLGIISAMLILMMWICIPIMIINIRSRKIDF